MTVAALYVDQLGPYPTLDGVEWYGEERDARTYSGPHPIVAHPPCGPWGRLFRLCTKQDKSLAPLAVEQLLRFGGVLEHPKDSLLWKALDLPLPGEAPYVPTRLPLFRPCRSLWTLEVDQCRWGHKARKRTWLLMAGIRPNAVGPLPPWQEPTHVIDSSKAAKRAGTDIGKHLPKSQRHLTPPAFAQFLVGLARAST